jgi:hypothetical protein
MPANFLQHATPSPHLNLAACLLHLPLLAEPYQADPAASAAVAATMQQVDFPALLKRVDQGYESWLRPSLLLFGTSGGCRPQPGWLVCLSADCFKLIKDGQQQDALDRNKCTLVLHQCISTHHPSPPAACCRRLLPPCLQTSSSS